MEAPLAPQGGGDEPPPGPPKGGIEDSEKSIERILESNLLVVDKSGSPPSGGI